MTETNNHIAKSIHLDEEYYLWLAEVKSRYRSAQLKAAVKVNSEKLAFNWLLGAEIVQKKAEERWGTGEYETGCFAISKLVCVPRMEPSYRYYPKVQKYRRGIVLCAEND